jgi:pimeloyl-ACP methyl ester carboxylesterase
MMPSRSTFLSVRGLRYHLREWGPEGGRPLFLLHGWMDVSASFQFLVDALQGEWRVIAPDWRGFGLSAWQGDCYWFPDYLGDLDAILSHYSPAAPADLVGHSMGGNLACLYAGVRPGRVRRVVALDAFGLPPTRPEQAPGRFQKWLGELATPTGFRPYPSFEALAARLVADNPRLTAERAAFLARHLGVMGADGAVVLAADPAHRRIHPQLYRRDEAEACWRRVAAPFLSVEPEDTSLRHRMGVGDDLQREFLACFRNGRREQVRDAGHNLHLDQPEAVARIIEAFLVSEGCHDQEPESQA